MSTNILEFDDCRIEASQLKLILLNPCIRRDDTGHELETVPYTGM